MPSIDLEYGDAFDAVPALPDDYGHAAVVDYPWEFDTENGTDRFGYDQSDSTDDLYETVSNEAIGDIIDELPRVVADGGWVFVWADDDTLPLFRGIVEAHPDLVYRRTWIWDRVNFSMGYYGRVQHYPIVTATVGDTDRYVQSQGTVISAKRTDDPIAKEYHTGKPVEAYRQMLDEPLSEGERLIEPFCGSAPGLGVCAERGLDYWGIDADPEALSAAARRTDG